MMMPSTPPFERLEQAVTMIARHADYPSKQKVVADCLNEIEDRWDRRELTLQQRLSLYAILMSAAASHRPVLTVV
jgi:hypothetical protein